MKKILIVEDDKVQTKVVDKIIKNINCETILVSNGREAIDMVDNRGDDIGLVLLDLALPDIGGLEVIKEIKKLNSDIPIAILSATEEISMVVKTIKVGADEFFIKFKDEEELTRLYSYIADKIHPNLRKEDA